MPSVDKSKETSPTERLPVSTLIHVDSKSAEWLGCPDSFFVNYVEGTIWLVHELYGWAGMSLLVIYPSFTSFLVEAKCVVIYSCGLQLIGMIWDNWGNAYRLLWGVSCFSLLDLGQGMSSPGAICPLWYESRMHESQGLWASMTLLRGEILWILHISWS